MLLGLQINDAFKFSLSTILLALCLALNPPTARANQSSNLQPIADITPSLPAEQHQGKTFNTPAEKNSSTKKDSDKVCAWWGESLPCWISSWNYGTVPDWGLFFTAIVTAYFALRSLRDLSVQAKAAKQSSDAAIVASMPVLSSLIVGGKLHPFPTDAEKVYPPSDWTFDSSANFVFENFGKTPGMIREVRADLFLCEMDQFPIVDFSQLPLIDYKPIIAGDSRGQNALMGVAECTKKVTLSATEFTELLGPAEGEYRRFALIGHVIYDDFFGNRHVRRFCVKMRLMDKGLFQLVRGGKTHNDVERYEIPTDDVL